MGKGSKVRVISGMWEGKRGVVLDLTVTGEVMVALVDDLGSLGQWVMKPFELMELEDEQRIRPN